MSVDTNTPEVSITLETATSWARSNREWDKVYRYLFLHPEDFFVISPGRKWPIAHQVVYHGDVDLLKQILALTDVQIDIRSKSADNKTLLDVATERRNARPLMYTYVEHLFTQDQLIEAAKQNNWRGVNNILEQNKDLANEKPPYSPYFLLHYVVENGDAEILQDLLDNYQFLTNVLNTKNETPLDMATRLKKTDMCTILRPKTVARPAFVSKQPETPPIEPTSRTNERNTSRSSPISTAEKPVKDQQPSSISSSTTKSIDPNTQLPCIGFAGILLDLSQDGDFTVAPSGLFNSAFGPPPPSQPPKKQPPPPPLPPRSPSIKHVHSKKSIVSEYPVTNDELPLPPTATAAATPKSSAILISADEQLMKNLTCPLSQQIFVDPVIASDGQTYERSAIRKWIDLHHNSPMTGALMDATFRDNNQIKGIVQSIQRQS